MHNIINPGLDELMEMVKRSYYLVSSGREFHYLAAWCLKLLVPFLVLLVLGISNRFVYLKL